MTILFGIAAYLAAYFALGWWLAKRDLPRAWAVARNEWSQESFILDSVKGQTIATFLCWPVVMPARALNRALTHTVAAHDPREKDRRIREQATRIKDLERELGIGGDR